MALFRPGPLIGAISGNVDGVNFATSSQRPIVRRRRRRPNDAQSNLTTSQANLQRLADAWAAASAAQRNQWNTLAATQRWKDRVGQARQPTGRELHASWNLSRMLCGLAIETATVPLYGTAPDVFSLADAMPSPGHISVQCFFTPATGSVIYGMLYGAVRYARGTSRWHKKLQFVTAQVPYFGSNTFTFDVTTQWSNLFGEPQSGMTYWVGVRILYDLMLISGMVELELTY